MKFDTSDIFLHVRRQDYVHTYRHLDVHFSRSQFVRHGLGQSSDSILAGAVEAHW